VIENVQHGQRTHEIGLEGKGLVLTGLPEEVAQRLDRARTGFLRAGALVAAAHASIELVLVLAGMGRRDRIQPVIDELRRAVRQVRRHGEALFALYQVTNAVALGTDLDEAAAGALSRLPAPETR